MFLSERIRAIAPANAIFYRLTIDSHDGTTKVFPLEEGSYYKLGDSPYGVPTANYTICFYDDQYRPMPHHNQSLQVNLQSEVHRSNQSQLSLHLAHPGAANGAQAGTGQVLNAASTPAQPAPPIAGAQSKSGPHATASAGADGTTSVGESDPEFQKYLRAMDLEERQQDFIKNSTYVTEVGELFTLNRIMRRELMELQRIIVLHSQQAYKDIEYVKGTVHDLLQLQREVLGHAASYISRPPVPPPDYVGLGHSALSLIREIGVALINRSQARGSGQNLPTNTQIPQLPAHPADSTESSKAQHADIIDKMVQKLKNSTDMDMAMAMSSPANWKAMFDELMSAGKVPTPPTESERAAKK